MIFRTRIALQRITFGVCVGMALLVTGAQAQPAHGAPSVRYDMRYASSDDRLQVFDDGVNTRLLLPEGTLIPLVRTLKSGDEQLVPLQRESVTQFLLIPGLHHKLILSWPGQRHVRVDYQGNASQAERAGSNTAYGATAPLAAHGYAPAPQQPMQALGDNGLARAAGPVVAKVAAQAVQPVTPPLAAGADPAPVNTAPVATPTPPSAEQGTWEVRVSDINLENTFKRWAKEVGYQMLWDADKEVLLPAADSFTGSLKDAINRVLGSPAIRFSNLPLEAVIYPNNPPLIRVTRLGEQQVQE